MNFMFSWQEQYLTCLLRSLVRHCSCHSNIKFISSRHRVISSMYSMLRYSTLLYYTHVYYTLLFSTLRYSTPLYATLLYSTLTISTSEQYTATDLINLLYFLRPVLSDHTDFFREFEQDG